MLLNGLCALIVRGLMYFTSSVCLKSEVIIGVSFDGSGPIKKGGGALALCLYSIIICQYYVYFNTPVMYISYIYIVTDHICR